MMLHDAAWCCMIFQWCPALTRHDLWTRHPTSIPLACAIISGLQMRSTAWIRDPWRPCGAREEANGHVKDGSFPMEPHTLHHVTLTVTLPLVFLACSRCSRQWRGFGNKGRVVTQVITGSWTRWWQSKHAFFNSYYACWHCWPSCLSIERSMVHKLRFQVRQYVQGRSVRFWKCCLLLLFDRHTMSVFEGFCSDRALNLRWKSRRALRSGGIVVRLDD